MDIHITTANTKHTSYAEEICQLIEKAALKRGTGIAKRKPEYIRTKIDEGKAVVAIDRDHDNQLVAFCYIESWEGEKYIANSGLIVHPNYRKLGLGRKIKERTFELSRSRYPNSKIFGITTSMAVMKINSDLGYRPVTFSELTQNKKFWDGCKSCPNYDILTNEHRKDCLCTGMLYDPQAEEQLIKRDDGANKKRKRWNKFKQFLKLHRWKFQRKAKNVIEFRGAAKK